jgi:hypothetical protein
VASGYLVVINVLKQPFEGTLVVINVLKQPFEGSFNMVIEEVAWRRPPLSMKTGFEF